MRAASVRSNYIDTPPELASSSSVTGAGDGGGLRAAAPLSGLPLPHPFASLRPLSGRGASAAYASITTAADAPPATVLSNYISESETSNSPAAFQGFGGGDGGGGGSGVTTNDGPPSPGTLIGEEELLRRLTQGGGRAALWQQSHSVPAERSPPPTSGVPHVAPSSGGAGAVSASPPPRVAAADADADAADAAAGRSSSRRAASEEVATRLAEATETLAAAEAARCAAEQQRDDALAEAAELRGRAQAVAELRQAEQAAAYKAVAEGLRALMVCDERSAARCEEAAAAARAEAAEELRGAEDALREVEAQLVEACRQRDEALAEGDARAENLHAEAEEQTRFMQDDMLHHRETSIFMLTKANVLLLARRYWAILHRHASEVTQAKADATRQRRLRHLQALSLESLQRAHMLRVVGAPWRRWQLQAAANRGIRADATRRRHRLAEEVELRAARRTEETQRAAYRCLWGAAGRARVRRFEEVARVDAEEAEAAGRSALAAVSAAAREAAAARRAAAEERRRSGLAYANVVAWLQPCIGGVSAEAEAGGDDEGRALKCAAVAVSELTRLRLLLADKQAQEAARGAAVSDLRAAVQACRTPPAEDPLRHY
eukprot:Rhum_TRINITY_DN11537_c0_g1::Rhum_TRINITY_DN11537_c0_g1_i1::g.44978::m.44978